MIDGGYYIKARKIQDSEIAHAPPHVREIWDWLIKEVNHTRTGKYKRGETMRSLNDIQNGLCWYVGYRKEKYSKSKCEMAMNWLRKRTMIETIKTTRGMFITICNYDIYQNPKNYETNSEKITKTTRKQQTHDTINKNVKNDKNEKNVKEIKILVSDLENSDELYEMITFSYWQLFNSNLNKFGINSTDLKKAKAKNWITNIRLMMENDNRTREEIFEVFDFLKNNKFWAKIIFSTAKLREKFETLLIQAKANENTPPISNTIASAKISHEGAKQILKQMRHEN